MVDDVLVKNAKKMLDSGVSEDDVVSMLGSMGYEEAQIKDAISVAKGGSPDDKKAEDKKEEPSKKEENEESKKEEEKEEEAVVEEEKKEKPKEEDKAKEHSENAELASSMAMNVTDNAVSKLDEHKDHLNNLHKSVEEASSKLDSIDSEAIKELSKKMIKIEKDLGDLVAKTNVNIDLMKKVLDSQRDILMKLK